MTLKEKMQNFYKEIDRKFTKQFGFRMRETTFLKIVKYLHEPKDSSSLAVTRILFGLAMLFDIPDERGGAIMEQRWGGHKCHFPLLPFVRALPMPYMAIVYAMLWLGALGIMLGYKYRTSSVMFTVCYWYLFLVDKSYWNNHSYLFGLVALLLSCTRAHCFWSIDVYIDPTKEKATVPYWNYFVLKYQFFILYFMAGMKKGTAEWLTGYSVQNLSQHWVFDPFKLFLTVPQIDYLIVHWFIFVFDLTIAMWMMWEPTRHVAMFFCAMFHLMNSRLFTIGMFPWVCLATLPMYYPFDWPKIVLKYLKEKFYCAKENVRTYIKAVQNCPTCNCKTKEEVEDDKSNSFESFVEAKKHIEEDDNKLEDKSVDDVNCDLQERKKVEEPKLENTDERQKQTDFPEKSFTTEEKALEGNLKNTKDEDLSERSESIGRKEKLTTCLIFVYVAMQAFLPYSHFITKGYNNWTNGLYGYSWDMMVHSWDTQSVVIKIVDNENDQEFFIDPSVYAPNDRWMRHGDMVYQYAKCLNENLMKERDNFPDTGISGNVSVYVDIWCSMNGRFAQRLFDTKIDLLRASWSPFEKVPFLMPLLDEALHWRSTLERITEEVHSWNNKSDVVFLADFPNYVHEKFIPQELHNVTLTVLEGVVVYEPESTCFQPGKSYMITTGNQVNVDSGLFHTVLNIGHTPAYYMYTFTNTTRLEHDTKKKIRPKLPIFNELYLRFRGMVIFFTLICKSFVKIIFGCNGGC